MKTKLVEQGDRIRGRCAFDSFKETISCFWFFYGRLQICTSVTNWKMRHNYVRSEKNISI